MLAGLGRPRARPRWPAPADAGCTLLAAGAPAASVTGCWASQSTCTSGRSRRSSAAIGHVAAGVPEADRRAEPEHPAAPVQRPRPPPRQRRLDCATQPPTDHVADEPVDHHRLAGRGQVPGALASTTSGRRSARRSARAAVRGLAAVLRRRTRRAPGSAPAAARPRRSPAAGVGSARWQAMFTSGPLSSVQLDHVLELLGGVRLRQQLPGEEELDEARPVPPPVVPVVLRPALVGVQLVVARVRDPLRQWRPQRRGVAGRATTTAEHPVRVVGGDDAARPSPLDAQRRPARPASTPTSSSTATVSATSSSRPVRGRVGRPVRAPVAAAGRWSPPGTGGPGRAPAPSTSASAPTRSIGRNTTVGSAGAEDLVADLDPSRST